MQLQLCCPVCQKAIHLTWFSPNCAFHMNSLYLQSVPCRGFKMLAQNINSIIFYLCPLTQAVLKIDISKKLLSQTFKLMNKIARISWLKCIYLSWFSLSILLANNGLESTDSHMIWVLNPFVFFSKLKKEYQVLPSLLHLQ